MKHTVKYLVFSILTFFSINSYAVNAWYFGLSIKDVRVQAAAKQASFRTVEAENNPGGCPNADFYAVRPENNPQFTMSMLLAAFLSKKKIDIYVRGDECGVYGRPSVTDVRIVN